MRDRSPGPTRQRRSGAVLTPGLVLAVVLGLTLAGLWGLAAAVGGSRHQQADPAATRAWLASEALADAEHWEGLPADRVESLSDALRQQLEAMGPEPSQSAREQAESALDGERPLVQEATVTDPQHALLSTARDLMDLPVADQRQRAVNVSAAAYRAAVAVDLGADPGSATALAPEPDGEFAVTGAEEGSASPQPGSAESTLRLASALADARFAQQTWAVLPEHERPRPGDWSRSLEPVLDGAWNEAVISQHPGVVSGRPGMPEGFRTEPRQALELLLTDLVQAGAAQIIDAPDAPGASAPGEAVLLRAVVSQVRVGGIDAAPGEASAGLDALPGLETARQS